MIEETQQGGVCTIRLNDPERRNAFSTSMRIALLNRFREIEADESIRAIVLSGGPKFFSVGADIKEQNQPQSTYALLDRLRILHDLVRLMLHSSKPRICAIEGWAAGGGLSLAMLCDTLVAGAGARFKPGFGDVGLIPDTGILHTLTERVGQGRARQILLYNEAFDAAQALQWGVVDKVVEQGKAEEEARRLASLLAAKPPLPIALTRSVLASRLEEVLLREREIQVMLIRSSDAVEARAAFFEKRPGSYAGQ